FPGHTWCADARAVLPPLGTASLILLATMPVLRGWIAPRWHGFPVSSRSESSGKSAAVHISASLFRIADRSARVIRLRPPRVRLDTPCHRKWERSRSRRHAPDTFLDGTRHPCARRGSPPACE